MITSSTLQRSVIVLPSRLETVLEKIYSKHKCPPITDEIQGNGRSLHIPPQMLALSDLEFKKAFLLLTYIPGKDVGQLEITAEEIRGWKDLSMVAYEAAVWERLGKDYCSPTERRLVFTRLGYSQDTSLLSLSDGSYTFKILGDDNVLTVKFEELQKKSSTYCNDRYSTYKRIAKNEERFLYKRSEMLLYTHRSTSGNDMATPYIFSGKSIYEARKHFMHVHTLPSLANYMARFSLILSKTKKLEVDMTGITFETIEDIHCHDENDKDVLDKNGKPCIHSEGIVNVLKGKCLTSGNVQNPPLLIQFRMFYDGYAAKGTFLLNKKLPPRTVQVRPSMIKVSKDPALSNVSTFNSLRGSQYKNKVIKKLGCALSYGGVPDEFFLDILLKTLEESKTIFNNKRAALKVALNYGDLDDHNAARMILAGIPLDEPQLQDQLSIFSKIEKNDLKAGRLPVSESYYLMGTVDPTGELKEDEVCVILEAGQISGDVLVYRNPGLHFGDIHVLKATYVKALEEYVGNSKYGVFFPQKGSKIFGSAKKPSQISPEEELFNMYLKTRFHASNVVRMAADRWLTIMDQFLTLGDERAEEKAEMKKQMLKLIDIYRDALDAPKKGAEVNLPDELKSDIFPHYMERDQKFMSTSILGMIYDFVKSQTAEEHKPSAEKSKLSCFEDEPVSDYQMENCGRWYEKYREEVIQAMGNKDESAIEVIQIYKQEFYGGAGFEELYPKALALYNIVYDHALKMNNARNCGFVWKVAGPILCRFYLEKTEEKFLVCPLGVFKKVLLG
ncbi:hypothetical protein Bca52824_016779 [Brassica carinata]|uniref:RNA-dependent RNA polymerase n=1 Tax=Brassica carinata TaxID=52824 RepID=A0A8X7W532_BRACI|nr:hypothetical protein Bca52824_016779 [Brassica carinata]